MPQELPWERNMRAAQQAGVPVPPRAGARPAAPVQGDLFGGAPAPSAHAVPWLSLIHI